MVGTKELAGKRPTQAKRRTLQGLIGVWLALPLTAGTVTFDKDVAPILYQSCAPCHRAGEAGPFPLLTYADARKRASQLVAVTARRYMPPWPPEPGYGDFADSRRLTDQQIRTIAEWVQQGEPEGNAADLPRAPQFVEGWQLGQPDLVVRMPVPFTLPASGTDVFRNFVIPLNLTGTRYIRAIELRPGNKRIVHHANIVIDHGRTLRAQDGVDGQPGFPGMDVITQSVGEFDPDSHFLFWKPDTPALIEPEGMPWRLDPGNDLVLNIHLKPSGKPETVDAQVGLYFTPDPPSKQPILLALERDDQLDIPAGDSSFVIEDSLTLPTDVEVLGAYPHAHYLGHDMEGWAILPSGEKKWLVWIKNWDIDRQSVYRYKEPLLLPKGTVLHMKYTYDNSAANPHNPHNPPVRVRAGNRSEDEMGHLWLQVLPVNAPANAPDPRLLIEEAWMRRRLEKTPTDPVSLYNLAAALAGQGKFSEAATVYEQELKLNPGDARTLTAMGAALDGAGQWQQAQDRYRAAIQAAPADQAGGCDARFDLANLYLRHDDFKAAQTEFRAQLAACPEDAESRSGLGAALQGAGRADDAEREFRRALELDPNDFTALLNLGAMASAAGQPEPAAKLLEAAIGAKPTSPEAHEKLAAAYAQQGRLNDALTQLRIAAGLAPTDAKLHSSLSQVLDALWQSEEAFAEQKQALQLDPNDADGWNNLGALLARGGQTDAARAAFEHALKLQPDHEQARANLARLSSQK